MEHLRYAPAGPPPAATSPRTVEARLAGGSISRGPRILHDNDGTRVHRQPVAGAVETTVILDHHNPPDYYACLRPTVVHGNVDGPHRRLLP